MGLIYWILSRSCGHDQVATGSYGGYLLIGVWLPGHCLLTWVYGGRVELSHSLALGLPLGFAYEIGLYLACAAAGLSSFFTPVLVGGALMLLGSLIRRWGWRHMLPDWPRREAGAILLLALVALVGMMTAAAMIYAPAPLVDGRLLHSTHHDWVYLVSRAAELRHHWPLEDPSLAGTPLSYHYFLMAHVAAAAQVTGLEIPLVLLRLVFVPMGIALLMQAFALGELLGRSAWSGALAAALLLATGEVSWLESSAGGLFQSLFIQWLYISPTFFFGMIFMGALLVWMHRLQTGEGGLKDYGVLFVLAVAGTGAKGTTTGPLAAAAALWCLWQLTVRRRWPGRMVLTGIVLTGGFLAAYMMFLRGYSGQGTDLRAFAFPRVSAFWLGSVEAWRTDLAGLGLAPGISSVLAQAAGWVTVLVGLNGVLLIGLYQAFRAKAWWDGEFGVWLGLVAVSCIAFGNLLFLDSHGESYLYLPMKLPLAALAAAALVALWRNRARSARLSPAQQHTVGRMLAGIAGGLVIMGLIAEGWLAWWGGLVIGAAGLFLLAPPATEGGVHLPKGAGRFLLPLVPLMLVLAVQIRFCVLGNRSGFTLWQASAAAERDPALAELNEGLAWVRGNTPADALIVAATFIPGWATPDAARVVDRTTADKHYYYSALAERRLFIEGPAYVRDQREASARMKALETFLGGGTFVLPPGLRGRSVYLLIDRAVSAEIVVPATAEPVFENPRVRLFRLPAG